MCRRCCSARRSRPRAAPGSRRSTAAPRLEVVARRHPPRRDDDDRLRAVGVHPDRRIVARGVPPSSSSLEHSARVGGGDRRFARRLGLASANPPGRRDENASMQMFAHGGGAFPVAPGHGNRPVTLNARRFGNRSLLRVDRSARTVHVRAIPSPIAKMTSTRRSWAAAFAIGPVRTGS